jgi:hypothetical protein
MTPALKARILGNIKANEVRAGVRVPIPPIEPGSVELAEPAQCPSQPTFDTYLSANEPPPPSQPTITDDSSASEPPPPSSPVPEDNFSDTLSFTSTLPDVFEVEDDDSGPLATGPWTVIDHFTGETFTDDEMFADDEMLLDEEMIIDAEMVIDEEEVPPVPPAALAVPAAPFDFTIQVQINPILGVLSLVPTPPPTLLFEDNDERPEWLIRSTNGFLQYTPYYMCLNKVVDLFFAQEARLGYPDKASENVLCLVIRLLTPPFIIYHSPLVSLYRLETGPSKLPHS